MNSRERVLKVLNHEIPDRVPIDLSSSRVTGISAIAYNNLISKTGFNVPLPKMYDVVQQLVYPDSRILEMFKVTCVIYIPMKKV